MKINPYRQAFSLLKQRILWDLNPESWSSRRRLNFFSNAYSNQRAVILCNGPSLNSVNFDQLGEADVFVFGLNKINLLFERSNFRPDAIVAVNPLVLSQNAQFYNETSIPLFLEADALRHGIRKRRNSLFLHSANVRGSFATDCSMSIFQGHTVTFVALQLAFHMGFKEVALVGCDHYFSKSGPANKKVAANKTDADHFDPRYFSGDMEWQLPDLLESEISYMLAKGV